MFQIRLIDFGLAKEIGIEPNATLQHSSYTPPKNTTRTLPYVLLPPEGLTEMRFSLKSEVWEFGIFMWEVFSLGKQPYSGILTPLGNISEDMK